VLYQHYQEALIALQGAADIQTVLRRFELNLLCELGYGINLETDCHSHAAITSEACYRFTPDVGFQQAVDAVAATAAGVAEAAVGEISSARLFSGQHLIALREMNLSDESVARTAKRLLRIALGTHLGEKPLTSRSLFATKPS
jgi:DNA repair protein RecO (recombination protein O)